MVVEWILVTLVANWFFTYIPFHWNFMKTSTTSSRIGILFSTPTWTWSWPSVTSVVARGHIVYSPSWSMMWWWRHWCIVHAALIFEFVCCGASIRISSFFLIIIERATNFIEILIETVTRLIMWAPLIILIILWVIWWFLITPFFSASHLLFVRVYLNIFEIIVIVNNYYAI